jgi:hypothetical protein
MKRQGKRGTRLAQMERSASIDDQIADLGDDLSGEGTAASLTATLMRIARVGEAMKDAAGLSVARAALMDVAKLNGLLVERSDNRNVTYGVSDKPMTQEEWVKKHVTEH